MTLHDSLHFLALANLRLTTTASDKTRNVNKMVLSDLRHLHATGGAIDAVFVLGDAVAEPSTANYRAVDQILESVYEECIEHSDRDVLPSLLAVPGPSDRIPAAGSRGAIDALTEGWERTKTGLWRGEYDDVTDVVARCFAIFGEWAAPTGLTPGALLSEGSTRLCIGRWHVGILAVNSAFRMLENDSTNVPPTIELAQLDAAAPDGLAAWSEGLDLVILAAGRAAEVPTGTRVPMLGLAGSMNVPFTWSQPGSDAVPWLAPTDPDRPWHSIVSVSMSGTPTAAATGMKSVPANLTRSQGPMTSVSATPKSDAAKDIASFHEELATGQMILVNVSGISRDLHNAAGEPLANPDTLTTRLLTAMGHASNGAMSPVPLDEALRRAQRTLGPICADILEKALVAADDVVPHVTQQLLIAPWERVYDFTGSNALSSAVERVVNLKDDVRVINAHKIRPSSFSDRLDIVAMNGIASLDDSPVTFASASESGTTPRDLWFQQLRTDLLTKPVVFVAHDVSSPTLEFYWNLLNSVDDNGTSDDHQNLPEPRRRFLVAPGGTEHEWRLSGLHVTHIDLEFTSFAKRNLATSMQSFADGKKILTRLRTERRAGTGVQLVRGLIDRAPAPSSDYLRGYEPTWGDIAAPTGRMTARLHHVDRLRNLANSAVDGAKPIIVLRGTAGAGKTTSLMQYAAELVRQGKVVGWVDRTATQKRRQIQREAEALELDAIMVDNVEIFGMNSAKSLRELRRGGRTLVIASIRTTRLDTLDTSGFQIVDQDDPLTDRDLRRLIRVLDTNGKLGILQGLSPSMQVEKLRDICQRELLAAMIEIVNGRRFEDVIRSEYDDLNDLPAFVYGIVSFFVTVLYEEISIGLDDLIQITNEQGYRQREVLGVVMSLLQGSILVEDRYKRLLCRHRSVADRVVEYLKSRPEILAMMWRSMLQHYASRDSGPEDRDSPDRRVLIRLLSHSLAIRLGLPKKLVRQTYDSVHSLLKDDFHFWLQRGSYEIEARDLELAANYLHSARGCRGGHDDFKVLTAFGTVVFRQAQNQPSDARLAENALSIHQTLMNIVVKMRSQSPHTFVTLIRDGYGWVKATKVISSEQRQDIRQSLSRVADLAEEYCSDNPECMAIVREYRPKLERLETSTQFIPL